MNKGYTAGLIDWLSTELVGPYLPELIADIRRRAEGYAFDALQPGDTEYTKGYAAALRWVADLPEQIVVQSTKQETVDQDQKESL